MKACAWRSCSSCALRGDVPQDVEGCTADVGRDGDPGVDAALQPGDPDHEELVEVGREDRQEVRALEQRLRAVLAEFEHALVEPEPAELTVEVAVGGQRLVLDLDDLVEVVQVGATDSPSSCGSVSMSTSCHPSLQRRAQATAVETRGERPPCGGAGCVTPERGEESSRYKNGDICAGIWVSWVASEPPGGFPLRGGAATKRKRFTMSRVLSTEQAKSAIRQIQSIVNGGSPTRSRNSTHRAASCRTRTCGTARSPRRSVVRPGRRRRPLWTRRSRSSSSSARSSTRSRRTSSPRVAARRRHPNCPGRRSARRPGLSRS